MHHSNDKPNENERPSLSFSFSDDPRPVSTEDLIQKVKDSLQGILNNRFDHWEKRIRFDVHQHDTFDEGTTYIDCVWNVH